VEDQQPAAGDLTEGEAAPERDESDTATTAAATESGEVTTAEAGGKAAKGRRVRKNRKKWLTGTRLAIAAAVAAVLFVGSAAFAGAAVQPYLTDRAVAATKLKVARTAANAITALWTYTPENMDKLGDRASVYLSGDFEAQYRKFVDAIVAPNKQAKVTNTTEVIGAAVESLDDPNAVVIVYTNTTSKSPLTKNIPSLKYLSYRLFMKRTNGRWLVNRMTTITSLDLTPHL
jgi:Mce-associated membrane protein